MNRIKEVRKQKKLSQVELASKLGVNQTAISQWERGSTLPSGNLLPKLTALLDTSSDYLLGISDEPPVKIDSDDIISKITRQIVLDTLEMDESSKKEVYDILSKFNALLSSTNREDALTLVKDQLESINKVFNKEA